MDEEERDVTSESKVPGVDRGRRGCCFRDKGARAGGERGRKKMQLHPF